MLSRVRAYYALEAIDWGWFDQVIFVTLTYPGEWPKNGRVWASHLRSIRRFLAKWGYPGGVWKREHQARGAPHFHLWIISPLSFSERPEGWLRCFREELSKAWFRIVRSGDPKHLAAGTQVKLLPPGQTAAGYFKSYLSKGDGSKEYQHRLPPGVTQPGRWWGTWGRNFGVKAEWHVRKVALQKFHEARRFTRRMKDARRRRVRASCLAAGRPFGRRARGRVSRRVTTSALAGMWAVVPPGAAFYWAMRALGIPGYS